MNPPQPTPPSDPPASRLVAIWVPDWPVVALTLETRQQRRHARRRRRRSRSPRRLRPGSPRRHHHGHATAHCPVPVP